MSEAMFGAILVAVPATITALASWRASRRVHAEVKTNHGHRAGEYLDTVLPERIGRLEGLLDAHAISDREAFDAINEKLEGGGTYQHSANHRALNQLQLHSLMLATIARKLGIDIPPMEAE